MSDAEIMARIEQAQRWREIEPLIPAFVALLCFALTLLALWALARGRGEGRWE